MPLTTHWRRGTGKQLADTLAVTDLFSDIEIL